MDISMDIHEKSVDMDMDMDVIFHIHGNPDFFTINDSIFQLRERIPLSKTEQCQHATLETRPCRRAGRWA